MTGFQGFRPRRGWMVAASAVSAVIVLVTGGETTAQEPAPDKSGYHLFNPTPPALMRPLSADRPDATESPITVDAGHVQVEMSFVDFTHDDEKRVRTTAWTVLDTNLKIGLFNNVDLQIVTNAYSEEETDPGVGPSVTLNGFGDVQLRVKVNLWGNDPGSGDTALGVMPFIKIPTGTETSNDKVEGGLIWMLGWDAAEHWGLGFQAEVDFVFDAVDNGYDIEFAHTVVLGFDVVDPLGAYVEYIGVTSSDPDANYRAIFSAGLTYQLGANLVLDVGTQVGLNKAADDIHLFAGMTVRY